ncbi:winged helix-turn-helix domain-containing protein [Vibrio caribbeanicus]|uniref:OmpR/PhoB-type domain-containing protein n=1 Tax=Vibrio caribbeanicus ATCC BAA-2122 TaxID=796620 RepID=E3BLA5_9VIBR|nr:winged helix-turn-helix domain-containing protein [Vibrio caribbeanicus]EFP96201.1 hypothetical protein VIBC2010_03817 [Vibrio caribbeanicus ATCC BAA-2122]
MTITNNGVYEFNDVIIDTKNMSIIHKEETTSLSYSDFLVFIYLVENNNKVAEKSTLMSEGWPGNIVTESSLHKSIYNLRYALRNTECIEIKTIPGKGYYLSCEKTDIILLDNYRNTVTNNHDDKVVFYFGRIIRKTSLMLSLIMILSSFILLYITFNKNEIYKDERFELIKFNGSEVLKLKETEIPIELKEILEPNYWYFYAYYNQTHQISVYDQKKNSTKNYFITDKDWKDFTKKWSTRND